MPVALGGEVKEQPQGEGRAPRGGWVSFGVGVQLPLETQVKLAMGI